MRWLELTLAAVIFITIWPFVATIALINGVVNKEKNNGQ